MKISVCIATYRREQRLAALLEDLRLQSRRPDQIVIVDNDAAGSSRAVVEPLRERGYPVPLLYDIQPERNISKTRNLSVALADGDWLAFIDDDERAPAEWLRLLSEAAMRYEADGVLAPVEPELPPDAPTWIRRGRFYDFPHQPEGATVPLNCMRFGNLLLRGSLLRSEPGPFDVHYGLTTGEDGDLLVRLAHRGARIVWTETAPVIEPIEGKRLALRWLLLRAMSGGQEFARQTMGGRFRPISMSGRVVFFCRALLQLTAAAALAALMWPAGRHRSALWLIRAYANLGKLMALWGARYRAYA